MCSNIIVVICLSGFCRCVGRKTLNSAICVHYHSLSKRLARNLHNCFHFRLKGLAISMKDKKKRIVDKKKVWKTWKFQRNWQENLLQKSEKMVRDRLHELKQVKLDFKSLFNKKFDKFLYDSLDKLWRSYRNRSKLAARRWIVQNSQRGESKKTILFDK